MGTSKEMTSGRALPLIFSFAMPVLLANLLQQTYSLIDAAIVGKFLGIGAFSAVGASTSVIFLIITLIGSVITAFDVVSGLIIGIFAVAFISFAVMTYVGVDMVCTVGSFFCVFSHNPICWT